MDKTTDPRESRISYSSIVRRPVFQWPGGKSLAVYFALNVESYRIDGGLIEELQPASPAPDVLNYSWCEYGNRVGVWRLRDLFDRLQLPVTLLVNSNLFDHHAEIVDAFRGRGDEIAAHGRTNSERQGTLPEAEEMALIEDTVRRIGERMSRRPTGWLSPWISESWRTLDLLKQCGLGYTLDWACDDQPVWMSTASGPLVAVPYPQELNDSSTIIGRQASVEEFCSMIDGQFEEMIEQSAQQPLVFAVALHTHISGQPFRLRALRRSLEKIAARREDVWITTAGRIAEHFAAEVRPLSR